MANEAKPEETDPWKLVASFDKLFDVAKTLTDREYAAVLEYVGSKVAVEQRRLAREIS